MPARGVTDSAAPALCYQVPSHPPWRSDVPTVDARRRDGRTDAPPAPADDGGRRRAPRRCPRRGAHRRVAAAPRGGDGRGAGSTGDDGSRAGDGADAGDDPRLVLLDDDQRAGGGRAGDDGGFDPCARPPDRPGRATAPPGARGGRRAATPGGGGGACPPPPAPPPPPRGAPPRPAPRPAADPAAQLQQVQAIADTSGWDWRKVYVNFRIGFDPAACCHWGVYDPTDHKTIWIGPTAFDDPARLRYVVLHELAHAWQWRSHRLTKLEADMAPWGYGGIDALEAGADCIATDWGAD